MPVQQCYTLHNGTGSTQSTGFSWQAYRARNIKSEFSESHYNAVTMASMLLATLIGVPLLFLVWDMP
jgi:ABC-type spermidine/putrescine transport system permease subunit II